MQSGFQLFPEQASTLAPQVDHLYGFLIAVTAFFTALIFVLVFGFAIKYRRRPGRETAEQVETVMGLEIAWTAIPTMLVLVMFVWGASLFLAETVPPKGVQDVYVVGRQWMWKIQHPNGRREINELHVPVGRAVKLTLASQDVVHSFYIPAFRVKQDAIPGQYRTMWFEASKPGEYHLFCAEYCGTNHSHMIGRIVAMEDIDYQKWLGGSTEQTPEEAGRDLFVAFDCVSCHGTGSRQRCPPLGNLYGKQEQLENGQTVLVDETYIRESMLDPKAKIVRGYEPVMPSFRGQVSEEQILALIAYIKSLAPEPSEPPEKVQR
jgi:cytochrome c oxidase subunit II